MQVVDQVISLPQGSLYVKTWIPETLATSVALVLLHDSLGCVGQWRDFPKRLAETLLCRVVVYDRLGFGQSSARNDFPSIHFIEEEADIYLPYIKEALSIHGYVLMGHSVGGAMSLNIAAKDLDCQGVISISAQAFIEEVTLEGLRNAEIMFSDPMYMAKLERWHGEKAHWVLRAWIDRWLSDDYQHWSLANCIGQVICPVMAMHGDQDEYGSVAFPEYIVNHTAGDSVLVILKDCGHIPHKEKTTEVLDEVSKFFKKICVD